MLTDRRWIAVDTETTGLQLVGGQCSPFMVSMLIGGPGSNGGYVVSYSWPVDPWTREVSICPDEAADIAFMLAETGLVLMHNAPFDLLALRQVVEAAGGVDCSGEVFDWDALYEKTHDTMHALHVLDSAAPLGLKDNALLHCGMLPDDEDDLKRAVTEARAIGKRRGMAISSVETFPQYRTRTGQNSKESWWKSDMWLPAAIAEADGYPPDHPWHTVCMSYCNGDVERTFGVADVCFREIEGEDLWQAYELNRGLIGILTEAKREGIVFDMDAAKALYAELEVMFEDAEEDARACIFEAGGDAEAARVFNFNSHPQKMTVFFGLFGLEPKRFKKKTGNPCLDSEAIEGWYEDTLPDEGEEPSLVHSFLHAWIKRQMIATQLSYLHGYIRYAVLHDDGLHRLHPDLNPVGTTTGRLSGSNPNPQNVSNETENPFLESLGVDLGVSVRLRSLFLTEPGMEWWPCDLKSCQYVLYAIESGEDELYRLMQEGWSPHEVVACEVFGVGRESITKAQKTKAKNAGFGKLFGSGNREINRKARSEGIGEMIDEKLPNATKYRRRMISEAKRNGCVRLGTGYPVTVDPKRAFTTAVNYVIQGKEAEIVKLAMILCDRFLRERGLGRIVLQVHDELIFGLPSGLGDELIGELCGLMEEAARMMGAEIAVTAGWCPDRWSDETKVVFDLAV